jgi:hypothetical protein
VTGIPGAHGGFVACTKEKNITATATGIPG